MTYPNVQTFLFLKTPPFDHNRGLGFLIVIYPIINPITKMTIKTNTTKIVEVFISFMY